MFLKCDPHRIWCSIFYSKLVNCILLRSLFVFMKGRGTCGSGERNVKIWIDFRKSPRFSLTSPLSQEREKSSRPVFTMCGEPCNIIIYLMSVFNFSSYNRPVYHYDFWPLNYALPPHKLFLRQQFAKLKKITRKYFCFL
jgi:hypothetical protein